MSFHCVFNLHSLLLIRSDLNWHICILNKTSKINEFVLSYLVFYVMFLWNIIVFWTTLRIWNERIAKFWREQTKNVSDECLILCVYFNANFIECYSPVSGSHVLDFSSSSSFCFFFDIGPTGQLIRGLRVCLSLAIPQTSHKEIKLFIYSTLL